MTSTPRHSEAALETFIERRILDDARVARVRTMARPKERRAALIATAAAGRVDEGETVLCHSIHLFARSAQINEWNGIER